MAVYSGFGTPVTTTPTLAVTSEPVDRAITILPASARVRVGFDNTSGFLTGPEGTQFLLPEDEELWLWVDSGGPVGCEVLVSKAPGI